MLHSKRLSDALIVAAAVAGTLLLRRLLQTALLRIAWISNPTTMRERILFRYQGKEFHAWMFARFKTHLDAMFDELPAILEPVQGVRNILDLGCGFGIAGCFLLESYRQATVYALDPSKARTNAAAAAMGARAQVFRAGAPDFEQSSFPPRFDVVFAARHFSFSLRRRVGSYLASHSQSPECWQHARGALSGAGGIGIVGCLVLQIG